LRPELPHHPSTVNRSGLVRRLPVVLVLLFRLRSLLDYRFNPALCLAFCHLQKL
jgi:hypothetical protein